MNSSDFHYNLRVSKITHERINSILSEMAKRNVGAEVERTKVVRILLDKGLDVIEKELKIK